MAFERVGDKPSHSAQVYKSGNNYEYNFYPSIPVSTPKPQKVCDIITRKIVPKGGGLILQAVIGGEPVIGLAIPQTVTKDIVEELFAAFREFGVEIQITNEAYAQSPVETARSTFGCIITCNIFDTSVPTVTEAYEKKPDGTKVSILREVTYTKKP